MRSRKISSFSNFIKCSVRIFKGTASNFSEFEAVPLKIRRAEQGYALKIGTFSARNAGTYFYEKTLHLDKFVPKVFIKYNIFLCLRQSDKTLIPKNLKHIRPYY